MTEQPTPEVTRLERVLAFMMLAVVLLSVGCFVAIMIGTATGVGDGFADGLWPVVSMLPLIGLPVAFVMIIVLLVLGLVRRSRQNRR